MNLERYAKYTGFQTGFIWRGAGLLRRIGEFPPYFNRFFTLGVLGWVISTKRGEAGHGKGFTGTKTSSGLNHSALDIIRAGPSRLRRRRWGATVTDGASDIGTNTGDNGDNTGGDNGGSSTDLNSIESADPGNGGSTDDTNTSGENTGGGGNTGSSTDPDPTDPTEPTDPIDPTDPGNSGTTGDTVTGGDNRIDGTEGHDRLTGDADDNTINAAAGDDHVDGGAGDDELWGGTGTDNLTGGEGDDWLSGGPGDDTLRVSSGNDMLYGGDGNDYLEGGYGNNTLTGGAGADIFSLYDFVGGSYSIITDFTPDEGDRIELYYNTNSVWWAQGATTGNIYLYKDAGGAQLLAILQGFTGEIAATHFIINGRITDADITKLTSTIIDGTVGGDELTGTNSSDIIHGLAGNDYLYGYDGADTLTGDDGDDTLYGQGSNDMLDGGEGNDTLEGGDGADTLTGGDGADIFVLENEGATDLTVVDVINDFGVDWSGNKDLLTFNTYTEGKVLWFKNHVDAGAGNSGANDTVIYGDAAATEIIVILADYNNDITSADFEAGYVGTITEIS